MKKMKNDNIKIDESIEFIKEPELKDYKYYMNPKKIQIPNEYVKFQDHKIIRKWRQVKFNF